MAGTSEPTPGSGETIQDMIRRVARNLGVDENLALAIAQQESGFDPTRIGDNGHSVGLFQLNDQGEGAGMSVEERKNPERNATIALTQVANVARDHPDWSGGQIAAAAQRPLDPTGYASSVNNILGGGVANATTTTVQPGTTSGPTGNQPPTSTFKVPPGGTLVTINGGYAMVLYHVAPGVALAFAVSDPSVDTSGVEKQDLSEDQWNTYKSAVVMAGDAKDLNSVSKDFPDFQTYWTSLMDRYLGPGTEARNDPGVLHVIAEIAARPDMSPEEIQNKIKQTPYWQARTEGQLAWNDLAPAEQQKRIADQMAILTNQYVQLVGAQPSAESLKAMQWWATQVASGAKGINEAINTFVKGDALNTPESPWNRTLRTEQENEKQRGVDVSNQAETARQLAAKWGVKLDELTLKQWGQDIVEKKKSDADYVDYLRGQAQVLYPWLKDLDPSGTNPTETVATPWLQTYQRVMEKPGDIFNPDVQKAMQSGIPVWQFEQNLKQTPDWLTTKNSQETMLTMGGDMGKRLGFG